MLAGCLKSALRLPHIEDGDIVVVERTPVAENGQIATQYVDPRRLKLHLFEVFNAGLKDLHILVKGYVAKPP